MIDFNTGIRSKFINMVRQEQTGDKLVWQKTIYGVTHRCVGDNFHYPSNLF